MVFHKVKVFQTETLFCLWHRCCVSPAVYWMCVTLPNLWLTKKSGDCCHIRSPERSRMVCSFGLSAYRTLTLLYFCGNHFVIDNNGPQMVAFFGRFVCTSLFWDSHLKELRTDWKKTIHLMTFYIALCISQQSIVHCCPCELQSADDWVVMNNNSQGRDSLYYFQLAMAATHFVLPFQCPLVNISSIVSAWPR